MLKGQTLKDGDWGTMKLKDGSIFLMMGTKDEDIPTQPTEKTKFVEDMDESELASAMDMPAGLENLGNTCYMNATVQCLKTVPEFKTALEKYQAGNERESFFPCFGINELINCIDIFIYLFSGCRCGRRRCHEYYVGHAQSLQRHGQGEEHPSPGPPQMLANGFPKVCREVGARRIPAAGRQRMLD